MFFQKKSKKKDQKDTVAYSTWLDGYSKAVMEMHQAVKDSFDQGYAEGYNDGRAAGVSDTKQAAMQAITKGASNGKKQTNPRD